MIVLRQPQADELSAASGLCKRSKLHWGYDEEFMTACEAELTITESDLSNDAVVIAVCENELAGVAQVSNDKSGCYLEKLFVDPSCMQKGIGRALFDWSKATAKKLGADSLVIEADPDAVPFYKAMRCKDAGTVASGSIAGRVLPRLILEID